jgi:hypothetical protein
VRAQVSRRVGLEHLEQAPQSCCHSPSRDEPWQIRLHRREIKSPRILPQV